MFRPFCAQPVVGAAAACLFWAGKCGLKRNMWVGVGKRGRHLVLYGKGKGRKWDLMKVLNGGKADLAGAYSLSMVW